MCLHVSCVFVPFFWVVSVLVESAAVRVSLHNVISLLACVSILVSWDIFQIDLVALKWQTPLNPCLVYLHHHLAGTLRGLKPKSKRPCA